MPVEIGELPQRCQAGQVGPVPLNGEQHGSRHGPSVGGREQNHVRSCPLDIGPRLELAGVRIENLRVGPIAVCQQ